MVECTQNAISLWGEDKDTGTEYSCGESALYGFDFDTDRISWTIIRVGDTQEDAGNHKTSPQNRRIQNQLTHTHSTTIAFPWNHRISISSILLYSKKITNLTGCIVEDIRQEVVINYPEILN